jgi:hypothetical protein
MPRSCSALWSSTASRLSGELDSGLQKRSRGTLCAQRHALCSIVEKMRLHCQLGANWTADPTESRPCPSGFGSITTPWTSKPWRVARIIWFTARMINHGRRNRQEYLSVSIGMVHALSKLRCRSIEPAISGRNKRKACFRCRDRRSSRWLS